MRNCRQGIRRTAALLLAILMLCSGMVGTAEAALQPRTLNLYQVQKMAISSSSDISKQNSQIILKKMKYVESVEGIKAKVKNLRSFRWTPLLSFKFPKPLKIKEEYDLNVKPLTILSEIDVLKHQRDDLAYKAILDSSKLYHEIYSLQESITFTQQRLDDAKKQLERNTAKLMVGDATQADVDRDKMEVQKLTASLTNKMRSFEKAKKDLSELLKLDISVGYRFVNGFQTANIPRSDLPDLIDYTLEHDQTYYEARATLATAKLNVDSYESLMIANYGSKMNEIRNFINMAKNNMDLDYGAFQIQYKNMLKKLDKPWMGAFWILFFKFPKEWFKGEIAGTRYIEDEMYAVYTACMEYGNAIKDEERTRKTLIRQVEGSYDVLVSNWNTYQNLQKLVESNRTSLDRVLVLNRMGKATYMETADQKKAYEDAQQEALDALKDYNIALLELDRLTCGAVSEYLTGTGIDLDTGESGDAFAVLDPISDPYYYIYSSVADLTFNIGVSIPDDFSPSIDSFEVWYGGMQIGERTPTSQELRHLILDYRDTNKLLIRLYSGDAYVDECEINAAVPRDLLDIESDEPPKERPRVVGSYEAYTTLQGGVSVSELKLEVHAREKAAYYSLRYGEQGIYTTAKKPLKETFPYLTILIASLSDVTAEIYDKNEAKLFDVRFDTDRQELVTIPKEK